MMFFSFSLSLNHRIIFSVASGYIADRVGIFTFFQWAFTFTLFNTLICHVVISFTTNVAVLSLCQIALALNAFGGMSAVFWVCLSLCVSLTIYHK